MKKSIQTQRKPSWECQTEPGKAAPGMCVTRHSMCGPEQNLAAQRLSFMARTCQFRSSTHFNMSTSFIRWAQIVQQSPYGNDSPCVEQGEEAHAEMRTGTSSHTADSLRPLACARTTMLIDAPPAFELEPLPPAPASIVLTWARHSKA